MYVTHTTMHIFSTQGLPGYVSAPDTNIRSWANPVSDHMWSYHIWGIFVVIQYWFILFRIKLKFKINKWNCGMPFFVLVRGMEHKKWPCRVWHCFSGRTERFAANRQKRCSSIHNNIKKIVETIITGLADDNFSGSIIDITDWLVNCRYHPSEPMVWLSDEEQMYRYPK